MYRSGDTLKQIDIGDTSKEGHGYDYTEADWEWWARPKETGGPLWTDPYFDEGAGNVLMCTYSVPFYRDEEFWGITTVDISLETLRELVFADAREQLHFGVVTKSGNYVFSEDPSDILKRSIQDTARERGREDVTRAAEAVLSGKRGLAKHSGWRSEVRQWTFFAPIESSDWRFFATIDEANALSLVNEQFRRELLVLAASLALIVLALVYVSGRIARPITHLTRTAEKIAQGDLEAQAGITGSDEIGVLGRALDEMAGRLSAREEAAARRYDFIVNSVSDLMSLVRRDYAYEAVNDTWCSLMGIGREEVLGRTMTEVWGPEVFETQIRPSLDRCLAGEEVYYEAWFELKASGRKYCEAVLYPYAAEGEEVSHAVIVTRDITERKEAEDRLKAAMEATDKARQEAEMASVAKSRFLANMSHEIRTPMNAILGFSDILSNKITEPQLKEYVDTIRSSGKSLMALIDDILDLSRVEAGELEIQATATEIGNLCQEVEVLFAPKAADKRIGFAVDVADGLPAAVLLDEARLKQILVNLVDNAIKFTDEGHVRLAVEAKARGGDGFDLTFRVQDTGAGIPEDQQELIFGAFEQQQDQSINDYGGTGLGLTIVRKLAAMMDGEVSLISRAGIGSTFIVTLRNVKAASVVELETKKRTSFDVEALRFLPAKVLVADGVELDRSIILGHLENLGIELLEAHSGVEAVEMAQEHHPNLILMDLELPVLDGLATAQKVKEDENLKGTPVVAFVAAGAGTPEDEAVRAWDAQINKPVEKDRLLVTLARFLDHYVAEAAEEGPEEAGPRSLDETKAMSTKATERLPELVGRLESEKPHWEEMVATLDIDAIELFATGMQELASEFGYPPLSIWAERLASQVAQFDLDAAVKTLEGFAELVQEAKERTET